MTITATEMEALFAQGLTPECQARWFNPRTGTIKPCSNQATWAAMAHDEAEDHDYVHLPLCGRCLLLVKGRQCPEDNLPLVKNAHRI